MTLIGTDGGMMGSGTVLPNGAGFPVLRIKVNRREKAVQILPQRLSTIERYRTEGREPGVSENI